MLPKKKKRKVALWFLYQSRIEILRIKGNVLSFRWLFWTKFISAESLHRFIQSWSKNKQNNPGNWKMSQSIDPIHNSNEYNRTHNDNIVIRIEIPIGFFFAFVFRFFELIYNWSRPEAKCADMWKNVRHSRFHTYKPYFIRIHRCMFRLHRNGFASFILTYCHRNY